ncbi:hypothetical protein QFC22_005587 [Naganishia vaughanmartiniae]|uniref:Uncharacterized protein n=1 Tax=Naganishia vaughanmartiniae TaxID=1424756 RepID=A0ACC2WTG0_9TREE|nr:hypothetical protein QFC22_005587 [Naganishia vaughanmartiniae]
MRKDSYRVNDCEIGQKSHVGNERDYFGNVNSYTAADNLSTFHSSPDFELLVIPDQRRPVGQFRDGARRLYHRLTTSNFSSRSIEDHHSMAEKKARDQAGHPSRKWRPMGMYKSIALLVLAAFIFSHTYFGYLPESLSENVSLASSFSKTQFGHGSPRKPALRTGGWEDRRQKQVSDDDNKEAVLYKGRHEVKDGLLKVNLSLPVSKHPIKQLIREAQTKWAAKNAKQSTTLKQAVEEYKRRHRGNLPPIGFDKWWKFVRTHNVPLVDEYDNIMRDIGIFAAFTPRELNNRLHEASKLPDTFTLSFQDGRITTERTLGKIPPSEGNGRIKGQVDLLVDYDIASWVPDCRMAISLHDHPRTFIGYEHRADLVGRTEEREFADGARELNPGEKGWHVACSYSSNARNLRSVKAGLKPDGMHFVEDMSSQMDLCAHPYNIPINGITGRGEKYVDDRLLPLSSLSKTALNADILIVPTEQWTDKVPVVPWNERTNNKLLWRGSNTGTHYSKAIPWRNSQRIRFVNETRPNAEGAVEYLPPPYHLLQQQTLSEAMIHNNKADLNENFFDIAFVGSPIQCDKQDGTCEELEEAFDFKNNKMSLRDSLNYKYVLDMDGNAWSARFSRLLAGGSLVFKSTIMPEWWNDRSQAWVHYVPIQLDNSDLYDTLAYFRGDNDGMNGDDKAASQIAAAGRAWFETHSRREDMAAYMSRLYLEWARLLASDRGDMDFVYSPHMEIRPEV